MVFRSGGQEGKGLRSAVPPASGLQSFICLYRSLAQDSTSLTSIQLQRSSVSLISDTWQIHKYGQTLGNQTEARDGSDGPIVPQVSTDVHWLFLGQLAPFRGA